MGPNYYDLLGVDKEASEDKIRKACKKELLRNGVSYAKGLSEEHSKIIEKQQMKLLKARDTLLDPNTRKAYDNGLRVFGDDFTFDPTLFRGMEGDEIKSGRREHIPGFFRPGSKGFRPNGFRK